MTSKSEAHFQENCPHSLLTCLHPFWLFWSVVLSEFASWEEIPSALCLPSVTASGLHHSKPNLSESPYEQPTFLLGAISGHLLVLPVAGNFLYFLYGTASL